MVNGSKGVIGTLYLIGSPIGNLEDISFRALRILKELDYLYCEDSGHTAILLKHHRIQTKHPIRSFHDYSRPVILQEIQELFSNGNSIGYITDAGMPVVSDPGFKIVRAAYRVGAKVVSIPGPCVAPMIFALSGLESPKFLFHGFFPRKKGEITKITQLIQSLHVVHIFYESAKRLVATLEILARNHAGSQIVIARELTKLHEEVLRGEIEEIYRKVLERGKIKGECSFAIFSRASREQGVKNLSNTQEDAQKPELTHEQQEEISTLVKSGVSSKDAATQLSKKFGVSRRKIYEFIIHHLT